MSQELLSQLASEGVLARSGAFALDEAKAREKMGKFQLQHPHGYVLEFFQAAVLLGAERVDVEVDSDELWMSWQGAHALEREHLESMYSSVFQTQAGDLEEALKHLAIGMNASSSLNLSVQEMRCVGRDGKVLRRAQAGEIIEIVEVPARQQETEAGMVFLYLKERFRPSHLGEFFSRMVRDVEESKLLRDRCRFSSVQLTINGEVIDVEFARNGEFALCETYEITQGRIWLGLRPEHAGLDVAFLQHGVIADESVQLLIGAMGADVLVESAGFKKDISRASLVKDDYYQHVLHTELVSCVHDTMATYLERGEGIDPEFRAKVLADLIFAITQCVAKRPLTPGEQRLYAMARHEPLFRLASQVTGQEERLVREWLSLDDIRRLMERAKQRTLFYSHDNFAEVQSERVVLRAAKTHVRGGHDTRLAFHITQHQLLTKLAMLLNSSAEDASSYLQVGKVALKNRQIWERSFARADFSSFEGDVKSVHRSAHVPDGEWLWLWRRVGHKNRESRVTYYKDRKPLCHESAQLDALSPGLELHIEMPVEMNATFSQLAHASSHNQGVLGEVLTSFASFMSAYADYLTRSPALMDEAARARIVQYLSHAASGTLFDHVQFKGMRATRSDNTARLHKHWTLSTALESVSPVQRLEALSQLDVFASMPLFAAMRLEDMGVVHVSLLDIEQHMRAQRGKIKYVPRQEHILQRLLQLEPTQRAEKVVLLMRDEDRRCWEDLFSTYLLEDFTAELEKREAYRRFSQKPVLDPSRAPERCVQSKVFKHERGKFHLFLLDPPRLSDLLAFGDQGNVEIAKDAQIEIDGVSFRGSQPEGRLDVILMYEGREIEKLVIDDFVEGVCVAHVECDGYRVNDDYQRLINNRAYQQLIKKVEEQAKAFVKKRFDDLVDRLDTLQEREHAEVWGTVFRVHQAYAASKGRSNKEMQSYTRARVFELQRGSGRRDRVHIYALELESAETEHLHYLDAGEEPYPDLLVGAQGALCFPFKSSRHLFEHYEPEMRLKHCALTESTKKLIEEARVRFLTRPEVTDLSQPPSSYGAKVIRSEVLTLPGNWRASVFWWLDERAHDSMMGGIRIDMMYDRRVLQSVVKYLCVGRLSVTVDAQDLFIDPEYKGFIKNGQFYTLVEMIEEQVSELFLTWVEDRARHFEHMDEKERMMWIRYALQLQSEPLRTVQEARIQSTILALPLYRTLSGEAYAMEEVQELLIRQNGSRFQYVDERFTGTVPPAKQKMVFHVEQSELPLLRKLFKRLLFLPYKEVVVPRPSPESLATTQEASSPREPVEEHAASAPAAPPSLSKEERIIAQIRARHEALRTHQHGEVSLLDRAVGRLEIAPITRPGVHVHAHHDRVRIDPEHIALKLLLAGSSDELLWKVLMSSIYSAINVQYAEVTDEHEEHFLFDISMV